MNANTPDMYRKIVKYLSVTKGDFHTYQLHQESAKGHDQMSAPINITVCFKRRDNSHRIPCS